MLRLVANDRRVPAYDRLFFIDDQHLLGLLLQCKSCQLSQLLQQKANINRPQTLVL